MRKLLQKRNVAIGFLAATLLFFVATRRRGAGQGPDLSVTFIGLTNNPVSQLRPYRLIVQGSATGTYALFNLKNANHLRSIGFETVGVEELTTNGWVASHPALPWQGIKGAVWLPGSGAVWAIGWPPGLASNATWRLTLRWRQELCQGRSNSAAGGGLKVRHPWVG
jgi:hypothetical protein